MQITPMRTPPSPGRAKLELKSWILGLVGFIPLFLEQINSKFFLYIFLINLNRLRLKYSINLKVLDCVKNILKYFKYLLEYFCYLILHYK